MTTEAPTADLAFFTPTVKPLLGRFDSCEHYNQTKSGSTKMHLGAGEMAFIANREWFYVAAMGQDGWPYTQRHRGPKGFLRMLGARTVGFASLGGSQRYISDGSALLFLIDHASHAQLKIWADAEVSEDPAVMEKLVITRSGSPAEDVAFVFRVRGFDWGDEQ